MKRAKRLYLLLGVLALVCLGAFAVTRYEQKKEQIQNSDEVILEIDPEEVTALSWENDTAALAFHKDENWMYDDDDTFPVNEEKVEELLSVFESFGVSFIIEEVEDYGQYGLDNPVGTIHIETEEETYDITLGDYSTMDSERYVSIGDGNVYLVKQDPMDTYTVELSDMILHDEVPTFEQVDEITFTGKQDYQIQHKENASESMCKEDVYFTEIGGESLPLDTENVDNYMQVIQDTNLAEYMTYHATEEELETYGLDDPELTIQVKYTNEDEETEEEISDEFTISISRDPKEIGKESEDEEEENIIAYARVEDSGIIYKISGEQYKSLMEAEYNTLRHQDILTAAFTDVTKVEVTLEDQEYVITSKEKDDERSYYYEKEELDISDFKSALKGMEVTSFTEKEATEKKEISMIVHLDNENYPEVELEFYRYDGEHCLAVVDGEPTALVSRSDVVDLVEAVNAIVLK